MNVIRWIAGKKKSILLLVVTTILFLSAIEVFLRVYAPITPVDVPWMYAYDAQTGYRLGASLRIFESVDYQKEIVSNALGTADFREDFDVSQPLVFALGDSYTQGSGIPADMAYPFQLDLTLNLDSSGMYHPRFTVVNLGVFSYGCEQSILRLNEYTRKIDTPAVVLYMGYDNDYADDQSFLAGFRHRFVTKGSPYWPAWVIGPLQAVQHNFEIAKRVRMAYHLLRGNSREEVLERSMSDTIICVAAREENALSRLLRQCRLYRSQLIMTWIWPSPSYGWLKQWAARHEVPFADWMPRVNAVESAIPGLPLENNHSGDHLRGWVNRIIAAEFARQILRGNLARGSGPGAETHAGSPRPARQPATHQ
jgi:hypothetical protein